MNIIKKTRGFDITIIDVPDRLRRTANIALVDNGNTYSVILVAPIYKKGIIFDRFVEEYKLLKSNISSISEANDLLNFYYDSCYNGTFQRREFKVL